jgi:glucose-6-phosphate 1-epimerase
MAVDAGADGTLVVLRNAAGDQATVSLHGGQLLSWKPGSAPEQIYASPQSVPAPGKAVRGGTPVCFPQFSERGPLPKHGFARTSRWELLTPPLAGAAVCEARFQLDSAMVKTAWPHAFCLVLAVRLGAGWIELQLQAANPGRSAFAFTAALHTYLALPDVRDARVLGLQGLAYEDAANGNAPGVQSAAALTFAGETDRVYRELGAPLHLEGAGMAARTIRQEGFTDAVVWNPGPEKAARLGDMPAQDWTRMLCIEAAVVAQPVQLQPGRTWTGLQRIELARPA